jgi:hypothetical protein
VVVVVVVVVVVEVVLVVVVVVVGGTVVVVLLVVVVVVVVVGPDESTRIDPAWSFQWCNALQPVLNTPTLIVCRPRRWPAGTFHVAVNVRVTDAPKDSPSHQRWNTWRPLPS